LFIINVSTLKLNYIYYHENIKLTLFIRGGNEGRPNPFRPNPYLARKMWTGLARPAYVWACRLVRLFKKKYHKAFNVQQILKL